MNWLKKIQLRGPGLSVVNIIVSYCYAQKMLKETKTEETISFFVMFLLLVPFHYVNTLRIEQSHPGSDAPYVSG